MEVRNSQFAAFIDVFTPNTYVMVIMSDPTIRKLLIHHIVHPFFCLSLSLLASAATLVNVRNARKHFEKIEKMEAGAPIAQTFPS